MSRKEEVDPRSRVAVPITSAVGDATGFCKPTGSEDMWEGRLRIQRDFVSVPLSVEQRKPVPQYRFDAVARSSDTG
jgi:hypothetical protein